jgi:hypothetical protein
VTVHLVLGSKGEEYANEKVQFDLAGYVGVLTEEADAALGGFVGFEYMVSDLVGIDAALHRRQFPRQAKDLSCNFVVSGFKEGAYN